MNHNFLVILFICGTFFAKAQYSEIGLLFGGSVYQGDLAPSQVWTSIGDSHISYGAFYRFNVNDFFALKLGLTKGKISGDDSKSLNDGRKSRNLSFKSSISEFSLLGEFNLIGYNPKNKKRSFSPFLFGGIAVYRFNPKALYEGNWVELQPLGTEGQGLAESQKGYYKLTQFSIPFGAGIKYSINDYWNIGLELGSRFTFTDYLDDVSGSYVNDNLLLENEGNLTFNLANRSNTVKEGGEARGDPNDKDWYIIGGITLSYNISGENLTKFSKRTKSKCPSF